MNRIDLLPRGLRLSAEFSRAGLPSGNKFSADQERFLDNLAAGLRTRGYRADIKASRQPYVSEGQHYLDVEFSSFLGHPKFEHLQAFVADQLPQCEIRRDDINLVSSTLLRVGIQVKEDRIPLTSARAVPPAFKSIGTGLYRKAGDDHSIWALENDGNGGYSLVRKRGEESEPVFGELPRTASAELSVGDRVKTPDGIGRLLSFDRAGNPIVDLDGGRFLYRRAQVIKDMPTSVPGLPPDHRSNEFHKFRRSREQSYEADFYAKVFGDSEFANQLVSTKFADRG